MAVTMRILQVQALTLVLSLIVAVRSSNVDVPALEELQRNMKQKIDAARSRMHGSQRREFGIIQQRAERRQRFQQDSNVF